MRVSVRSGAREPETGVARVQRHMQQAERTHARHRRVAMIAVGLAAAVLALVVGGLAVFGNQTESTSALGAAAARTKVPAPVKPTVSEQLAQEAQAAPVSGVATAAASAVEQAPKVVAPEPSPADEAPQHYTIKIGAAGYEPSELRASSRSPITLTVGKGEGCAAGFLIPSLGISEDNSHGDITFGLGTLKPGVYRFSCAMEMVEGQLTVR